MKNMSLIKIATACEGVYHGVDSLKYAEICGITIDSRKIEEGFLFIPIRGARADGHNYINQVMDAGALCTLTEEDLGVVSYPYILVKSCEQALKDIAEYYRQSLGVKVVGITGSVGKTSTKEMIASVLSQKYNVLKTAGNFNNEIGLPLTIFNLREEHEVAVLEMGINHFGEMTRLSKVAHPDIAVITNIGQCHLEFLGNRDGVLKAKSEIFQYSNPEGTVILNGEDDKLATICAVNDVPPLFFGLQDTMDIHASDIVNLGLEGTSCTIHLPDGSCITPIIPIPGFHMVLNALAGASVGYELGLTGEEIKQGIEALIPVSGRNNLIKTNFLTIIDDCYNANPVSMKASLDVLATATTRKVAILGDMGELGVDEAKLHAEVGVHAASCELELICCIGTLSQSMYESAVTHNIGSTNVLYFPTKEDFISVATDIVQKNDAILVKASHFMGFDALVTHLTNLQL